MKSQPRMLRFGGPGLPPGTHTFYEMRDPSGKALFIDRVVEGHTIEAEKVVRVSGNDPGTDTPAADGYVRRGQASYVEVSEPAPKKD